MANVLIVGAGFYGATCARVLADAGHRVAVVDRRPHIGGNAFTRYCAEADCHEHVYGAHIFHTRNAKVWAFVNRFAEFNRYVHRVRVLNGGRLYSFPINLLTLHQVFGVTTPAEGAAAMNADREPRENPRNAEEWCLATIGRRLYETFVEGYSTKQWGRSPRELPASIVRRVPVRLNHDDRYFDDRWQGIPVRGYTSLFERMLGDLRVELGHDPLDDREGMLREWDRIIFSGCIDEFFGRCHGPLEYRSLRHETALIDEPDALGNSVLNQTEAGVPWTRTYEHKHFDLSYRANRTLVTREFPQAWSPGRPEFYPVVTEANLERLGQYQQDAIELPHVTFGGRLGSFRYYDMDQVIAQALHDAEAIALSLRA